jgi:hypothetical protein
VPGYESANKPPRTSGDNKLAGKCLPAFIRSDVIDREGGRLLVCSMRFIFCVVLAAFLSGATAFAQTTNAPVHRPPRTPTSLPPATAEPENPNAYAHPQGHGREGPTDADVGPVQKRFVRANRTDNLAATQVDDNASLKIKEKIEIDKRITVPLIHDVQNDGNESSGDLALRYEIDYLNWGAVTGEQLMARRGHYFTITWKNHGPKADFIARFEYREVKSKEIVRTLTQPMPNVSGAVRSYFAVTDRAYLVYGPVVSWRFTVLKGDTIVAEAKSFIW